MVINNVVYNKIIKPYYEAFTGLSKEVWWLALITLINRAGTMVIPFLSLYLTQNEGFSLSQVGWIMTAFGLGSVVGTWVGGKLTDVIGYYKVMAFSLSVSGIMFVSVQFLHGFYLICAGIFLLMAVADMFRPAVFVALSAYSKPQNKTRSVTLIRLAINLGFSLGPAFGGLIITSLSYSALFWVDGTTCILASILLLWVLNPKKAKILDEVKNANPKSAYTDTTYWIFFVGLVLFGFTFVQYFSTVPLFYKEIHHLSESQIGLILGLNGFLIFAFEMPLIKYFESRSFSMVENIVIGVVLICLSFVLLILSSWAGILIIGMILMTFGEMLAFPFSNAFAMKRAKRGNQGEYMALYSIAFSVSHIFGHNTGMQFVDNFGFDNTWYLTAGMAALSILFLFILKRRLRSEPIETE
ncbi:MDR family MFS transporter [Roseivirga echinicomitans]|uniref:MFS transporter n=1 Tax=Roseivirga echinicomitans TaxID=296218 RepID=A0A150X1U0_9BACT|nr:MFS transporter [Roseivirga echinicomitans]KYG72694.1 MFS transporter [Roseivirga echinicomitans]